MKIYKTKIVNFRKPDDGVWLTGPDICAESPEHASKILEDYIIVLCTERAHETVEITK